MKLENAGFGTTAIHHGAMSVAPYNPLSTPIFQSSTFIFDSCEQGARRFAGEEDGYIYTRVGNPTERVLEEKLAKLEGGEDAVTAASGMGAISACLWTLLSAGDHVITDGILYGCTYSLFSTELKRYGIETTFVDTSDPENVARAIRPNTRVVYLETPANPTLRIADIERISQIAHAADHPIYVVCDNTFATPYHQRPIELGCDVVVHSVTKYLNGHGDVIAGAIISTREMITEMRLRGIKLMTGSVLGPFECYLILRGLKTMEVRMQRHSENAAAVAEFLNRHPKVERVYYPGLESHPGHEVACRQMHNGFSGVVSFEVAGGREAGAKLLNNLELCTLAVSLGDAETLIEHPASMTHSTYSAEELAAEGISEGLIRLSCGLENAEDIIKDLEQGLALL